MKCQKCGGYNSTVYDTRLKNDDKTRWRRKHCEDCGARYTTIELAPTSNIKIVTTCDQCEIHGRCVIETMFEKMKIKTPYCCAGNNKTENE